MYFLHVFSPILLLLSLIQFNNGLPTNKRNLFDDDKILRHPSKTELSDHTNDKDFSDWSADDAIARHNDNNHKQGNQSFGNVLERIQLHLNGSSSLRSKREIGWNGYPIFYISHKIHDGFTESERDIIDKAMQVVVNRLTKQSVRDCSYRVTGKKGYHLASGVWDRSNLEEDNDYGGYEDLLRFQVLCIEALGIKNILPVIHIKPIHEKSKVSGRGTLGCVTFTSKGTTFSYSGEFNVKLNRYQLDAPTKKGRDINFWAGVIVHEMLHNLGHRHDDYTDSWQINTFKKCIVHDGNYWG